MKGRIIKWSVSKFSSLNKSNFQKKFQPSLLNNSNKNVCVDVLSFTGKIQFWDQVYSMSSFYLNVGKPISWVVYNDGTLTNEQISILNKSIITPGSIKI